MGSRTTLICLNECIYCHLRFPCGNPTWITVAFLVGLVCPAGPVSFVQVMQLSQML